MDLPVWTHSGSCGVSGWQLWVKVPFPRGSQCVHGCAAGALGLSSGEGNKALL